MNSISPARDDSISLTKDNLSAPYWRDPAYSRIICERVAGSTGWSQSPDYGFPLIEFSFREDSLKHLAVAPGFLSPATPEQAQSYFEFVKDKAEELGAITAFLQYRGTDTQAIKQILKNNFDTYGIESRSVAAIDLHCDFNDMIMHCRKDTRSRVRQMLRHLDPHFTFELHDKYFTFYDLIAQDNNFSAAYCYSAQDFKNMCTAPGITPISVFDSSGQYLGGSIIGKVNDDICDYILSAYSKDIPNAGRAVMWESFMAAQKMGFKYINLGGGVTEDDALYSYKKSFGAQDWPFYSLKVIMDEARYRKFYGPLTGDIDFSGRFPPA